MDTYLKSLLGDREQVLLITRQHWFVLLESILVEILLALAIVVGVTLVLVVWLPGTPAGWFYLLLFLPLLSLLRDILIWYNLKYIVTNRRVMQLSGIFNKNVTDSSLEKVNDVHMTQSVIGRLFDFGNIEIMTASEMGVNLFKRISDPIHFKTAMINAKAELEQIQMSALNDPSNNQIPALIAELGQLRQQGVLTEEEFTRKKNELLNKI